MRGRELYSRTRPFIKNLIRLLGFIPDPILRTFFPWFRHTPGMFGFGIRYALLRCLAHRCGDVIAVYPGAYFLNIEQIDIGNHVSIHQMCYFECIGGLKIGSHVSISHGVSVITHEHDYLQSKVPIREAPILLRPVVIEDDVWVGAGAKILGGVTLGKGTVVGAGAVVTRSVPANTIVAGVPAKIIGTRGPESRVLE